jgi:hypothetical protein
MSLILFDGLCLVPGQVTAALHIIARKPFLAGRIVAAARPFAKTNPNFQSGRSSLTGSRSEAMAWHLHY